MSNRIYEIVEEIATLSGTGRSKKKSETHPLG